LMILIMFGKEYKIWSFSLCSFLQFMHSFYRHANINCVVSIHSHYYQKECLLWVSHFVVWIFEMFSCDFI
jgi:hypothetical protein